MATGDVDGNFNRLQQELRLTKFPFAVDEVGLRLGEPVSYLRLMHYALLDYSTDLARLMFDHGFELRSKTDQKFTEVAFRVFRELLGINPVLTIAQMLQQGFAERKLILLTAVLEQCRILHRSLSKEKRLQTLKTYPRRSSSQIPKAGQESGPIVERACRPTSTVEHIGCAAADRHAFPLQEIAEPVVICGSRGQGNIDRCHQSQTDTHDHLELVARDSRLVKPLTTNQDQNHSIQQQQMADLFLRIDNLSDTVLNIQQELSFLKSSSIDGAGISERMDEIAQSMSQLETRLRFLEEREEKGMGAPMTTSSAPRIEMDARTCRSPTESIGANRVEDIINELSTRQNTAEHFLKEHKRDHIFV